MVEEEKNQTPETAEEPVAETPQDLIETGEAGLDAGPSKGPALDQDEGQIQTDTERNRRKERVGLIVSDRADKTVTVSVEALVRHPKAARPRIARRASLFRPRLEHQWGRRP